jgi:thioester reductase-like protein
MDLGLSGAELNEIASEVEVIHHCAAVTYSAVHRSLAARANIEGAREVLELADVAKNLRRLIHWSSTAVAGNRHGRVLESELEAPESFRSAIEETRFTAERIMREAMDEHPITVLRPSMVVGDSATGEIDRFDGPYLLVLLILNAPPDLRIPLPGRGDVPLNLVPVDYVVEAGCQIAQDPRAVGRTFHLVDPDPLPAREVFELIAKAAGRPVPRGFVPTNIATALLRTPGLERFAQVPRAFLEQLTSEVTFDDRNTRELLDGTGIECPRFESYVQTMVDYVRREQASRRAEMAEQALEGSDPLA